MFTNCRIRYSKAYMNPTFLYIIVRPQTEMSKMCTFSKSERNFFSKYISPPSTFQKILKQVEYESARRKRHINEKTRIRDEKGSTFFYVYLPFFILQKMSVKSQFLENSRELKRTWVSSREALVEVMEGKKLRKRGAMR